MSLKKHLFAHWGWIGEELALNKRVQDSHISVRYSLLANATKSHVNITLAGVITSIAVATMIHQISGQWLGYVVSAIYIAAMGVGLHVHVRSSKIDLSATEAERQIASRIQQMTLSTTVCALCWSTLIALCWISGSKTLALLAVTLNFGISPVGAIIYYSIPRAMLLWIIIFAVIGTISSLTAELPILLYIFVGPFVFSLLRLAGNLWSSLVTSALNAQQYVEQQKSLYRAEMERQSAIERESASTAQARTKAMQEAKKAREKELSQLAAEFENSVYQVVDGLSQAIETVRSTSLQLASTGTQASERTDEMTENSTSMANAVHLVAAATQQLKDSAIAIADQVGEQVTISQSAGTTSDTSSGAISKLADDIDEIASIAGLIQEVAAQTNMLALNASIEAARAGEAGKGFAVVATEIKSLAAQTQGAIETVSSTVKNIREGMAEAAQSATSVVDAMNRVQQGAQTISQVINEQKAATLEISRNAQSASGNAENVLACSSEVKATSQRVDEAADEMQLVVQTLEQQTLQLKNASTNFLSRLRAA